MAGTKTLKELLQELKDQICPEWQEKFVSACMDDPGFVAHVGKLSGGCRTCWPVMRKVLDFMAGALDETAQTLRNGPGPEQTLEDLFTSVENRLVEIDS